MKNEPLFSIIIPSFNQGEYIDKCLQSIIGQTFEDYEVIVQDNNSTDNTKSILQKYEKLKNFFIYFEKDKGQADAINKGIKKARGQWLTWQNCDDYYLSNIVFETFNNEIILDKKKKYGLFYGNIKLVKKKNNFEKELRFYGANSYTLILEGMVLTNQSCFWNKKLNDTHGALRNFRVSFDYEWFLRISQFTKFKKINHKKPIGAFVLYDEQKSNNYTNHDLELRKRIIKIYLKKLNIPNNNLLLKVLKLISKFYRFTKLVSNGDLFYLLKRIF